MHSITSRTPKEKPQWKAASSSRECISLTASSYFSSNSFCCSVKVSLRLSRFLPIRESRCLNRQLPLQRRIVFTSKRNPCGIFDLYFPVNILQKRIFPHFLFRSRSRPTVKTAEPIDKPEKMSIIICSRVGQCSAWRIRIAREPTRAIFSPILNRASGAVNSAEISCI